VLGCLELTLVVKYILVWLEVEQMFDLNDTKLYAQKWQQWFWTIRAYMSTGQSSRSDGVQHC